MKKIIAFALIALLTACQQAPGAYQPEPFAFESAAPIRVRVANIEIINHYQPPLRRPNVEQEFPVPPVSAVKKWLENRLEATGSTGTLQVTIHDGSVVETPLKKTDGVKGLFTDDVDARYDAKLSVTFKLLDGTSIASRATGNVEVTRSRTINERASVVEREKIYHTMTRDMMLSFDSEAQARLHQYFAAFLN